MRNRGEEKPEVEKEGGGGLDVLNYVDCEEGGGAALFSICED